MLRDSNPSPTICPHAGVVELVDTWDLKSHGALPRAGSSPASGSAKTDISALLATFLAGAPFFFVGTSWKDFRSSASPVIHNVRTTYFTSPIISVSALQPPIR